MSTPEDEDDPTTGPGAETDAEADAEQGAHADEENAEPGYAPGFEPYPASLGAIPPGVLQPDLIRVRLPTDGKALISASENAELDRASIALFRYMHHRYGRALNSVHHRVLPDRDLDAVGIDWDAIPPKREPLMSDERIEELWYYMGLNYEPYEKEQSDAVKSRMEEITPQFSLRNVPRVILDFEFGLLPWQLEVWFPDDAHVGAKPLASTEVFNYETPDMAFEKSSDVLEAEHAKQFELLMRSEWLDDQWGNWWADGAPSMARAYVPDDLFYMPRLRGRFANAEEAEAEAEERRKSKRYEVTFSLDNPDGDWREVNR